MAKNDWFVFTQSGNVTGSARLLADMDPLTSGSFPNSGSFCRAWGDTQYYYGFDGQFLNNVTGQGLLTLSSSYNGTLYNIPSSKAVSLRAYIRVAQRDSTIGLGAKIRNNAGNTDMMSVATGYRVYLEGQSITNEWNQQPAYIKAGWNTTSITTLATINNNTVTFIENGNVVQQRPWYHLRLDVIPVTASFLLNGTLQNGVIRDIVNIYTGSLGDPATETWGLLSSRSIPYTNGDFTPWSATDAYGIIIDVTDPSTTAARADACIERFEIYTSSI